MIILIAVLLFTQAFYVHANTPIREYLYVTNGMCKDFVELKESNPHRNWSASFEIIYDRLCNNITLVPCDLLDEAVEECISIAQKNHHFSHMINDFMHYKNLSSQPSNLVYLSPEEEELCERVYRKSCKRVNCLTVKKNAQIGGNLNVAGNTTLTNLFVSGALTVNGIPFGSTLAWAYGATQFASGPINQNNPIIFNAFTANSASITQIPNSGVMTIPEGTYQFLFTVNAVGADNTMPIACQLFNQTTNQVIPFTNFASSAPATAATDYSCNGYGIFQVMDTSNIQLLNNSGMTQPITLVSNPGTQICASLTLIRIAG